MPARTTTPKPAPKPTANHTSKPSSPPATSAGAASLEDARVKAPVPSVAARAESPAQLAAQFAGNDPRIATEAANSLLRLGTPAPELVPTAIKILSARSDYKDPAHSLQIAAIKLLAAQGIAAGEAAPILETKIRDALLNRTLQKPAKQHEYELGGEAALALGAIATSKKFAVATLLLEALATCHDTYLAHDGATRSDGARCLQAICSGLAALKVASTQVKTALERIHEDETLDQAARGTTSCAHAALQALGFSD